MKKFLVSIVLFATVLSFCSCATSNYTRRYYKMHKIGYKIMKKNNKSCPMFPKPLFRN